MTVGTATSPTVHGLLFSTFPPIPCRCPCGRGWGWGCIMDASSTMASAASAWSIGKTQAALFAVRSSIPSKTTDTFGGLQDMSTQILGFPHGSHTWPSTTTRFWMACSMAAMASVRPSQASTVLSGRLMNLTI
ncbi:hypothetical protein D3C71_1664030 [compost metagenome]